MHVAYVDLCVHGFSVLLKENLQTCSFLTFNPQGDKKLWPAVGIVKISSGNITASLSAHSKWSVICQWVITLIKVFYLILWDSLIKKMKNAHHPNLPLIHSCHPSPWEWLAVQLHVKFHSTFLQFACDCLSLSDGICSGRSADIACWTSCAATTSHSYLHKRCIRCVASRKMVGSFTFALLLMQPSHRRNADHIQLHSFFFPPIVVQELQGPQINYNLLWNHV